jgi:hypothetical protein
MGIRGARPPSKKPKERTNQFSLVLITSLDSGGTAIKVAFIITKEIILANKRG